MLQQGLIAGEGAFTQPQSQMGTGFSISDRAKPAVIRRQGFQHFRRQVGAADRLPKARQRGKTPLPLGSGLIELAPAQVVAHGLDAIRQIARLVLNAPEPVVASAAAALRELFGLSPPREALGGPAVHPHLPLAQPHHQREGGQTLQGRPHRRRLHHTRQHPGQPLRRQRQVGHRQLQQHPVVAALAGDRQQFLQQHIPRPQGQRLRQPLLQGGGGGLQRQAGLGKKEVQPPRHRWQPPLALAEQGIETLQQPRMAADGPQGHRHLRLRQPAQTRQPLQQLAGFGPAQGPQGHLQQPAPAPGQRMAAGEQKPAPPRRRHQGVEPAGRIGIQEGLAAGGEVLLEVVEHQQQGAQGQGLLQEVQPQRVVQLWAEQGRGQVASLLAPRKQGQAHRLPDRPQVKAAAVTGDRPALLRQPLHHPPRHTALAHPANAAQQHAPVPLAVAQVPQAGAQLPAPTHQITDRQLGNGPRQLPHRRLPQGLLVAPEVGQGPLLPGAIESGGGGLRQDLGQGGTPAQALLPLRLQLLARRRQGAGSQHRLATAEVAVEGAGQLAGVAVAHRGLHRHHAGDAGLDQGLGQAGAGAGLNAAVAGVEHHQRQGPAQPPQRRHQRLRRDRHRLADLILQLQQTRGAVAAQMQHVVGVGLDRGGDLGGMAHLQDLHRHVVAALGGLHGIENVLQLTLVIEQRRASGALIGGAHRHEHFQGPRQRRGRGRGRRWQATPQHHWALKGQRASVGQPQRLIGQAQQLRILRLDLHQHRVAHAGPIHQPRQSLGRARRQAEGRQSLAQGEQLRLQGGALDLNPVAGASAKAPQEGAATLPHRGRHLRARRRERGLLADLGHHRNGARRPALQPQPHPLLATVRRRAQGRRAGTARQQSVGDRAVLLDAEAAEGLEQGRNVGVIAHLHRNQRLTALDALVGEAAHLSLHPRALQRLGRKHDQARVDLHQPVVHPGDDVVSRADLPFVEPNVDALLAQVARQRLHGGLIAGGMAQKNPHRDGWR